MQRPLLTLSRSLVVVAAALIMTGCTSEPSAGSATHEAAQSAAADISRGLYRHGTDLMDDYVRWADEDTRKSHDVELVGYEVYPDAVHGEPLGVLQYRVSVRGVLTGDTYVACFESTVDYWGVSTPDRRGWSIDEQVAPEIECPSHATRITPPVDTRAVVVIPDGTEELVVEILTAAPDAVTTQDIAAEVAERMTQPTGEREVAFEPRALVADGEIGFAMGDAADCLLVKRTEEGVAVLDVPKILLQPGELGCSPATALRPEDELRSPH
ncbi:hypothetical protein [Microbacterium sp. ZW T5_56]|uniref:hypothetical protein n=1 Tax=Microbacterium sp. ZW T5_56 TaxID=3378081 RepID=UPI0038520384